MTHATDQPPPDAARLMPSMMLVFVAIAAALLFSAAFRTGAPQSTKRDRGVECGTLAPEPRSTRLSGQHEPSEAESEPPEPMFFAGGVWSHESGLAALAEIVATGIKPDGRLLVQSVEWDGGALTVIDVSPITLDAAEQDAPPALAIVSVDHAGGDPETEFATAIQRHLETLADAEAILVLAPLPGPTPRGEDEFPYDWTFVMLDEKTDVLDFVEIEPAKDLPGKPGSGYLKAWLDLETSDWPIDMKPSAVELLLDLDLIADRGRYAKQQWELLARGPYELVPALHERDRAEKWTKTFGGSLAEHYNAQALLLSRALGVHADDLVDRAAASDNPALRALAARAIGDLAGVTTDPLGRLTPLAEDKDMRVRYEALATTRAIPGRRAAGVAQLAGPYTMTDDMRALYSSTMAEMLAYGDPIPADSRADRLRRMPLDELLAEERDTIVCTILLERADLPDDMIGEMLGQLAEANATAPIITLLNMLEAMNPRTLADRPALLQTLARWPAAELGAQRQRLVGLINQENRTTDLRAAAAGAFIRSSPSFSSGVIEEAGLQPVVFEGIAWVDPAQLPEDCPAFLFEVAFTAPDQHLPSRVAALGAIRYLPANSIGQEQAEKVLTLARTAEQIDLRFAAIRAVHALPEPFKPGDIDDLTLTQHTLSAVPGKMAYDKTRLTVAAGRPVEITLVNPDTMEHNLVITRPGRAQEIGVTISAMPPAEAAAIGYIPDSDVVLQHTPMLRAGESTTLRFFAPGAPGRYDYVCTYPGHYTSMIGVLEVVEP